MCAEEVFIRGAKIVVSPYSHLSTVHTTKAKVQTLLPNWDNIDGLSHKVVLGLLPNLIQLREWLGLGEWQELVEKEGLSVLTLPPNRWATPPQFAHLIWLKSLEYSTLTIRPDFRSVLSKIGRALHKSHLKLGEGLDFWNKKEWTRIQSTEGCLDNDYLPFFLLPQTALHVLLHLFCTYTLALVDFSTRALNKYWTSQITPFFVFHPSKCYS